MSTGESSTHSPRILYLGNNPLGARVLLWLRDRGEHIVGMALHPPERSRNRAELIEASGLPDARVFPGHRLRSPDVLAQVRSAGADIAISVQFDYILRPAFIEMFPRGVINLHTSYLPYNRGQYPNVWSIIERTPAGATLHYIDPGIDSGDVIDQEQVEIEPVDTGQTLHSKLEAAAFNVFTRAWPGVSSGIAPRCPQPDEGTYHRTRDVEEVDRIDLDREYRAGDLIDLLRARTFPPYSGAFFEQEGRRVYLRLYLAYEEDVGLNRPGPEPQKR